MKIEIQHRRPLDGIPSASGIEATSDGFYLIGDDYPWLVRLDPNLELVERIAIDSAVESERGERIPKARKADFEALAARVTGGATELFLFGSGSKRPERDILVLARVHPRQVERFSLSAFYAAIRRAAGLREAAFNIEAAAIHEERLYLFNRGENVVVHCVLDDLLAHVRDDAPCPQPFVHRVRLPELLGREAGFSGATLLSGTQTLVFTASVELTEDWIADGEVAGSFIGLLELPMTGGVIEPPCELIRGPGGGELRVKVESVTVRESLSPCRFRLLLVTDSDDGGSELIEATLTAG